ncbi:AadA family aminoglycoside 3''-O-nucleotidyltransferase [Herminiimonas glaciei]|uniref:Aminoglycoside (3'') (9) adenylyltransferase n=1 Tax=Herminiimonas glaciei TaxID=523788 RepID=A0ABW2I977_9BURK
MTNTIPGEIAAQLASAHTILARHLGDTLQAIHLFGSSVDGGLKAQSDIDLLVTVSRAPDEAVRRALMMELLSISAWPGTDDSLRALEVTVLAHEQVIPWRYPARRELQFGEWLREDLQAGIFEPAMIDPDLAILLTKARQHSVCLFGTPASVFFDPVPPKDFTRALVDTISQWNEEADWLGDEQTVVLALCRIWYSIVAGGIAPKDIAVAWVMQRAPDEHQAILQAAQASYLGTEPDQLPDRMQEVSAFIHYAKSVIANMRIS